MCGMKAGYSTGLSSSITLSMTVFRMCEDIRVSVLLRRKKQQQDVGESLLEIRYCYQNSVGNHIQFLSKIRYNI